MIVISVSSKIFLFCACVFGVFGILYCTVEGGMAFVLSSVMLAVAALIDLKAE